MKLSTIILALLTAMLLPAAGVKAQQTSSTSLEGTTICRTDLSQKDQWHNLRRWVALTFDRSNAIDMEDAERGTMVIKWNCPVQLPTEFISATVQLTYVIDVRDGKYRLQKLSPRVSYQFLHSGLYEDFDVDRANAATADIKLINNAALRVFDGSYDWPAGEQYEQLADDYLGIATATPQYRNDRDRERGKISDDWRRAERNWKLISQPLITLRQLDSTMTASLAEALRNNDEF